MKNILSLVKGLEKKVNHIYNSGSGSGVQTVADETAALASLQNGKSGIFSIGGKTYLYAKDSAGNPFKTLLSVVVTGMPIANRVGWWSTKAGLTIAGGKVTKWSESSGNGLDFSSVGADPTAPVGNGGVICDGTNTLQLAAYHRISAPYTFYFNMKPTEYGHELLRAASQETGSVGYGLYYDAGQVGHAPSTGGAGTQKGINGSNIIPLNQKNVVAISWQGIGSPAKLFVNGVLIGNMTSTIENIQNFDLYGMLGEGSPYNFKGELFDIVLYNALHADSDIISNSSFFK